MKVDYSTKPNSKYFLFADISFRQGINHIALGIAGGMFGLSVIERIMHIAIGILKFIPIFGHAITLVDTWLHKTSIIHIKLASKDPFQRGLEHGRLLKKRIKEVYDPILAMQKRKRIVLYEPISKETKIERLEDKVAEFEKSIPDSLKEELKGLAEGSGYSYQDVVIIHTFLDVTPGVCGCTTMAVKETKEEYQRVVAANHSIKLVDGKAPETPDESSKFRLKAFLDYPISKSSSIKQVLQSSGIDTTIQSMVFDTLKGEIHISSKGSYAANGKFQTFKPSVVFDSHEFQSGDSDNRVRLFRNLDWPWYFLGQETILLTRSHKDGNSTLSVSWPGYIGTLSGMNNNGLTLGQNVCGSNSNVGGIPNCLLFTNILDTCKSVNEASAILEQGRHGSSINVVIADKTSARSYELEYCSGVSCVGKIES